MEWGPDREHRALIAAAPRRFVARPIRLAAVAGAAVVVLAAWAIVQWVRPYPLPEISGAITPQRAGLVLPDEIAAAAALRSGAATGGDTGWTEYGAALERSRAGDADGGLRHLAAAVRAAPDNLFYGNALRRHLARRHRWADLASVWAQFDLAVRGIRLQRALALVDAMADPDIADAGIGKLSIRSERDLTVLLERDPYDWLARYARGLNNLYWPVALRRIDKALADLSFCVAVVERLDLRDPWLALGHAAYGDALVKAGRTAEGLRVWRAGLARFPDSAGLRERAAAGPAGALEVVRRIRGTDAIKRPAADVADLSVIWDGSHP